MPALRNTTVCYTTSLCTALYCTAFNRLHDYFCRTIPIAESDVVLLSFNEQAPSILYVEKLMLRRRETFFGCYLAIERSSVCHILFFFSHLLCALFRSFYTCYSDLHYFQYLLISFSFFLLFFQILPMSQ